MPSPGVVNNPSGANSFNHFAAEPPYGEATQQANLAGGAPLAGQPVAAGPLGAPKRAQRQAVKGHSAQAGGQQPTPPTSTPTYDAALAAQWAAIAAIPGVSPTAQMFAQQTQAPRG